MESYDITRIIFLKALAIIYVCAYANIINQFPGLLGENGLLPVRRFIEGANWKYNPSLFFLGCSDKVLKTVGWIGLILSISALVGWSEQLGYFGHVLIWSTLWVLYLSYVNIGQVFYSFGWESLLLETGFVAIFFPPDGVETPLILIWLVRWILFRVMFGAGLIKLRGDKCWWDLTCLQYYYETQPMPNPLSRDFHHLPVWVHKTGVAYTHFAELIAPWMVLFPGIIGTLGGVFSVILLLFILLSGNLSWLNYLTLFLCIACFDDAFWKDYFFASSPLVISGSVWYEAIVWIFAAFIAFRSWKPIINLFSRGQVMNTSFDKFHLVNTYGAFGSITKRRFEIIIEGTDGEMDDKGMKWKEYEFKGKPGDISSCPPIVAPYHMRLDWLMWFAAMGSYQHHPWTVHLLKKLLEGQPEVLSLLKHNPFEGKPPKFIRADLYLYNFTESRSKDYWTRRHVGSFLPTVSLDDEGLWDYCRKHGWE